MVVADSCLGFYRNWISLHVLYYRYSQNIVFFTNNSRTKYVVIKTYHKIIIIDLKFSNSIITYILYKNIIYIYKKKGKRFLFFGLSKKKYLKKLCLLLFLPSISYIMYNVLHAIKYNSLMYTAYIRVTFFLRIGNAIFFCLTASTMQII